MSFKTAAGFTLLEVMITVVIVAILAAIAYPSYQEYVLRSNRSEGMALLNDAAARQERYYAQTNRYVTSTADSAKLGLASTTSSTGKYQLSIAGNGGGYTLTATPQGVQTRDTKCANLTLNAQGVKGKSGSSSSVDDCWR
ncbi:type IV pilin protein [Ectopseudomonas khazarica]|uniref:type IV pilin protein n=1 Tax=Ectopseudomonas khazarica TaxID=2502979 RepID=UPI001AEF93B6|nr:type IV pilin protein [Pseudomonas khazarica]QTS87542.1 type IV pilin protein [Pseudomonas khazarica]